MIQPVKTIQKITNDSAVLLYTFLLEHNTENKCKIYSWQLEDILGISRKSVYNALTRLERENIIKIYNDTKFKNRKIIEILK